ncbi:MAG: ATP-binding protein [Paracoccaceae bacterium]
MNVRNQVAPSATLRAMESKQRELEAVNLDLSRFVYGANHDLKAPLASIIGLLSFCTEDLEDGNFGELRKNLEQALELCHDGVSRIDSVFEVACAGRDSVQFEHVCVESVVREVWYDQIRECPDRLELLLDLGHWGPIAIDRLTLKLILDNLISNAVRFRDVAKSSLVVKVSSEADLTALRITVADNGSGIPEHRHDDVFRMFRHIDVRSGNGLGLALVKRHVERSGGRVAFKSVAGEGSEFTIDLPIEPGAT